MSNRPVRRKIENIDPMFSIPEGVDELVYDEELSDYNNYAEGTSEESEIIFEDEPAEDISGNPPAPRVLGIVSQTMKKLKSGDERVDVVLSVEDIDGVDKYEFRVSKR